MNMILLYLETNKGFLIKLKTNKEAKQFTKNFFLSPEQQRIVLSL